VVEWSGTISTNSSMENCHSRGDIEICRKVQIWTPCKICWRWKCVPIDYGIHLSRNFRRDSSGTLMHVQVFFIDISIQGSVSPEKGSVSDSRERRQILNALK
jgi:hypothetical protein